jgi:hypothetical protein
MLAEVMPAHLAVSPQVFALTEDPRPVRTRTSPSGEPAQMIQRQLGESIVPAPVQRPLWQVPVSAATHAPEAAHSSPSFGPASATQVSRFGSQTPTVQALESSEQFGGVPLTQLPEPSHVSAPSQNVESAQLVPPVTYWQFAEQQSPAPLVVFSSSHCSPNSTTPLPHTPHSDSWKQTDGWQAGTSGNEVLVTKPLCGTPHCQHCSSWQFVSQPSPEPVSASSHCSPGSTQPLPHSEHAPSAQVVPSPAHEPWSSPVQ